MEETLSSTNTYTKQQWIAEQAREHPERVFTSLHHLIDGEWMREAYRRTRKDGARGIDGVSAADYEKDLEVNLDDLLSRMKSGRYFAPPVRRHYIPKADGTKRPLGIPTFEDKVAQRAILMLLEPIYETDFLTCSYGFRPGRSAHDALAALRTGIIEQRQRWVIDADISRYFDSISHTHLRSFLDLRIKDGVVRRMIDKWLKAGVLEEGTVHRPVTGTPQGGVMTPWTQKATSGLSAKSWNGGTVPWLTLDVNDNINMTNGAIKPVPEGRATQRRLCPARPGRCGKRSRAATFTAFRLLTAPGLSLRQTGAGHDCAGCAGRSPDPYDHQDSRQSGAIAARSCPNQRPDHRRDFRLHPETVPARRESAWLNVARVPGPVFILNTISIASSAPSSRMPTRFWFPIAPVSSLPRFKTQETQMRIAAIYARVSSERQRDDNTIGSQTDALKAHAERYGYRVAPEMIIEDDGYSGGVLERPGLERVRESYCQMLCMS